MSTPTHPRAAEVGRRLTDASQAAADRHPDFADAIRRSFDRLRGGLALAHAHAEAVDDNAWAGYVTDLDQGLDELDKEIDHAADHGKDVDDTLVVHLTGIELQGWRLQVSLPGVAPKLATAETELKRYGTTPGSADALDRAMDDLRGTA